MNFLSLFIPVMLLVHNTVDFRSSGAQESYANKLNVTVTDWIEKLEEHNNIRLINQTGSMDEKICKLGLQFQSPVQYDIVNGRKMILQLIDGFLQLINSSDCLKPYLYCPPFTLNRLEISVNFVGNCKFSYFSAGQLKYLSFSEGVITYYGVNGCGDLEKLQEEPLDFARKVIAQDPATRTYYTLDPCKPVAPK